MKTAVEKEFEFFRNNHDELFGLYPNKYLVISDSHVKFDAFSLEEAVAYTISEKMAPGTFIIQQCTEGDGAYTQTFHSRAIFV